VSWFRSPPIDAVRWVVIDTETSGLDAARDRLLSVGAVTVTRGRIALAESFHKVLKQEVASAPDNVAIHSIGADAQLAGEPAAGVLGAFRAFLGTALPVGFNADFDAAVLGRAMKPLGLRCAAAWLDLAQLAPVLEPAEGRRRRSLDDWLERYGIRVTTRHDALADALATAELFLVLQEKAHRAGCSTARDLARLARAARWLQ
jgi:DNA polymerase-3 subunit epsilon